jgi:hypothetical protein
MRYRAGRSCRDTDIADGNRIVFGKIRGRCQCLIELFGMRQIDRDHDFFVHWMLFLRRYTEQTLGFNEKINSTNLNRDGRLLTG